jgi:hypothetical protein
MQKTTQYAAPVAGGAAVIVRTTQVSSRISLQEDASLNAGVLQGFIYRLATMQGNGLYVLGPPIAVGPTQEPVLIAGYPGDHPPNTVPIGNGGSSPFPVCPGGPVTHGTVICVVTSKTASAILIDATEN